MLRNFTLSLIFCFLGFYSLGQTTYTTFAAFKTALTTAQAGDEIVLANGDYTAASVTMNTIKGTAEKPIIVRAETTGSVKITAAYFDLRYCEYVVFQGFNFVMTDKSTTFKVQTCNNMRITQCVFDGAGEAAYKTDGVSRNSSVWIVLQGMYDNLVDMSHDNRIDHNMFKNKVTLGNMIKIDGTNSLYVSQHDVIEYNHFMNMGPRADNEMETIRIGWSAMSQSDGFTRVSNNLFEDCNGDPEIISVKCNKNTIAHNTFVRCLGTVSLRHGNETVIEGNFFFGEGIEGTGGVRIYGSNHKIINNFFQGLNGTKWDAPITLTQGDVESTSTSLSSHYRIENALVANNTLIDNVYGIEIGFNNNGSYSKPPRNVTMAYNVVSGSSNSLVNYINAPTTMVWIDNILFPQGTAVVGTGVSFTTEQAQNIDPKLALDPVFWYMKSTSNTPSFASYATAVGAIASDIEGQARVSPFTYGADQYSTEAVVYKPMLAAEVGPQTGGYLSLSRAVQSFGMGAESADVTLESNLSWGVLSSATWLTCTPTTASSGTKLTISVVANTTGQDRTATLTFTSTNNTGDTNITRVITVTQAGKAVSTLSISATNLSFDAAQASKNFDITSNTTWSIVSSETWLTVNSPSDTGNKTIAAQVAANTSRSARTAKLTISDGANLTAEIAVAQAGTVGTEVKLAVTSVVASTEQVSNEAVNVNDGLLTNRWSGDGDGATITLDLGDLRKISYLVVGIYKGDSRTSSFDIQTSTDGITFVNAIVGITTPITTDLTKIYDFADIDARYVRIVGHGNSTGTWNSYTEFEVWGWTAPVVTSVLEPESELTFCVYPNPSKDAFVVSHPEGAKLSIYNVSGICVRNLPTTTGTETQVSALPKGLYFLRMNANGAMQTKKIRID